MMLLETLSPGWAHVKAFSVGINASHRSSLVLHHCVCWDHSCTLNNDVDSSSRPPTLPRGNNFCMIWAHVRQRHPTTNQLAKAISCYPACIVVDPLLTCRPLKWPTAAANKETTEWETLGSGLEMLLQEETGNLSDVHEGVATTAF